MMQYCVFFIISYFLSTQPIWAYQPEEGNIHYLIGPILYKSLYRPTTHEPSVPWRGDFGFQVQGDFNKRNSLEVSMYHLTRDFYRQDDGKFTAETIEMMRMGLGYRRWLHSQWNLGLLLSTTYAMDEPEETYRSPQQNNLSTSASDISEFGLMTSIQFMPWSEDQNSLVIDIAYEKNLTPRPGESSEYFQFFVAFRRFVQSKKHKIK